MFRKLNIALPNLDIERLKGTCDFQNGNFIQYTIADLSYLQNVIDDYLDLQIPPDTVNITVIADRSGEYPHTDVWPVALNYYLYAHKEVTTFYDNPTGHKIDSGLVEGLHQYELKKLVPASTFIAKTDDCYLLNTHVPHTVSFTYEQSTRTILRFVWYNASYEEILNSIIIKTD